MRTLTFILIPILLFLSSCVSSDLSFSEAMDRNDRKLETQEARDDARFLVEAKNYNLAILQLADMANERGYARLITEFAMDIRNEHTNMADDIKDAAREQKIALPASVDDEMQRVLDEMQQVSREKFDATFLSAVEATHERAIADFEEAATRANHESVRTFAAKFVSTLRKHERKADELEDELLLK